MSTKNGTVKKSVIKAFANIRKTGIIAITLDKGDELGWVKVVSGKEDIVIVTALSQAIRFNEKEIRPMGRSARGVRGMKLRKDDYVIGMDIVIPESEIVVITENGFGKRTAIGQFASHHRGGVGIKAGVVTSKTGKTVHIKTITSIKEDLIVISKQGTIIRTPLKNISKIGRATQGVRIMKLGDGDAIASIASIPKVKEEEEQPTLGLEENTEKPNEKKPKQKAQTKKAPAKAPKTKDPKKPADTKSGFKVTEVKKTEKKKKDNGGFQVKKIK
jgi:DNA gyrase subunit A